MVALAERGLLEVGAAGVGERTALRELVDRDGQHGRKEPLLLDVCAMGPKGTAQLLTAGLTQAEVEEEKKQTGRGWHNKFKREVAFPISTIKAGIGVNILGAEATREIDKNRILNSLLGLAGAELNGEPPQEHPIYDTVNRYVASTFAIAGAVQILDQDKDVSKIARALEGDVTRKSLVLPPLGSALGQAADPQRQVGILCASIGKLEKLQHFALNLSWCKALTSLPPELGEGIGKLENLQHFALDLSYCIA